MIEEVKDVNVSLRNQAYETAWGNAYKQRYIERCAQLLVMRSTAATVVKDIQC